MGLVDAAARGKEHGRAEHEGALEHGAFLSGMLDPSSKHAFHESMIHLRLMTDPSATFPVSAPDRVVGMVPRRHSKPVPFPSCYLSVSPGLGLARSFFVMRRRVCVLGGACCRTPTSIIP